MAVLLVTMDLMVAQAIREMLDQLVMLVILDPQETQDPVLLQETYRRHRALGQGSLEILEILEQLPLLYIP
jgi:hypothetical protein